MDKHEALAHKGFIHKTGKEAHVITSREYSHDDGQHAGIFLGGLGTPVFTRDFNGFFSRWHLEPGLHINHTLKESFLSIAWKGNHKGEVVEGSILLNADAIDKGFKREIVALFPCMWERYSHASLPFDILLKTYSPFIPSDVKTSSLPLAFFDVEIECHDNMEGEWEIASSLFFVNLLGWRNGYITSVDRTTSPFPAQTHAGNTSTGVELANNKGKKTIAVCQQRNTAYKNNVAKHALEGEILLFVSSDEDATQTREVCYKAGQNRIGIEDKAQKHTIAWLAEEFAQQRKLPQSELTWEAHWDEAIGSAVASTLKCKASEHKKMTFGLVLDCPITEFAKGRTWHTKYTEYFGTEGNNAKAIAEYVLNNYELWQESIYTWHKKYIEESALSTELAISQINELYFLLAGGTVFVQKQANKEDYKEPILGDKEHFGLLEGFDVGYHYYNTVDLWVYAFPALSRNFPTIADSIFEDILNTIPLDMPQKHMIYREAEMRPILVKGKIPHDFGAAESDPWHDLNGYQMRDDSNQWLDHVPTVLVSYYLHCSKTGLKANAKKWEQIKEAFYFMLSQQGDDALPHHSAFGDSTWDNLGLKGLCTYTSTAVIAAYHVVQEWAKEFNEPEIVKITQEQLEKAYPKFLEELWTGSYFRACTQGVYDNCIMPDSIIWLMYLNMANIDHKVDKAYILKHLESSYTYNYKKHGFHGPLLICEPERGSFPPDGGDIGLQVNEVLLGAAWATASLMHYYGLEKASVMAQDMAQFQHGESSLHFRTPAAWDNLMRFRAPLNMRPLSIWLLDWK